MYKIILVKHAVKTLQRMSQKTATPIREKLEQIAADPYIQHQNTSGLQGRPGYRLRMGDWRVIYEIKDDELVVLKIATRGEVYR